MDYTVLYETWQMQCCGDPFKIGDEIVKEESVDGYDGEIADYSETAFLVRLTDITLREAKRGEVTFE